MGNIEERTMVTGSGIRSISCDRVSTDHEHQDPSRKSYGVSTVYCVNIREAYGRRSRRFWDIREVAIVRWGRREREGTFFRVGRDIVVKGETREWRRGWPRIEHGERAR